MSDDLGWQERLEREAGRRRRRQRAVGLLVALAFAGGVYALVGSSRAGPHTACGPVPAPPLGPGDLRAGLAAYAHAECEAGVAGSKPPKTLFAGTLTPSARAVADAYVRDEWVERDCAAAQRLFRSPFRGYVPECDAVHSVLGYEDLAGAQLVRTPPLLERRCTESSFYRVRASQCFVYRFILQTNSLSSSTDAHGRTRRYWEWVIIRQMVWLRPEHGRWRVILEGSDGDREVFVRGAGAVDARALWARRYGPVITNPRT